MDSKGKMEQKLKSYARSEVHLTELLEDVCVEMRNYSGFTEELADGTNRTVYHRFQNRPEEKGALKLQHFGWSVHTQDRLRLACDAISATLDEELMEAYMSETEVAFKKKVCPQASSPRAVFFLPLLLVCSACSICHAVRCVQCCKLRSAKCYTDSERISVVRDARD
jgi:hypothetical protein